MLSLGASPDFQNFVLIMLAIRGPGLSEQWWDCVRTVNIKFELLKLALEYMVASGEGHHL